MILETYEKELERGETQKGLKNNSLLIFLSFFRVTAPHHRSDNPHTVKIHNWPFF